MAARERIAQFRDWLRDNGLPATPQRLAIADVVLGATHTISAEEITGALTARGSTAGVATVYRTLDVLVASGLVVERNFAEGFRRFESADRGMPNTQLLCTTCGGVEAITDPDVESLAHRIALTSDFEADRLRLIVHGSCASCRQLPSINTEAFAEPHQSPPPLRSPI